VGDSSGGGRRVSALGTPPCLCVSNEEGVKDASSSSSAGQKRMLRSGLKYRARVVRGGGGGECQRSATLGGAARPSAARGAAPASVCGGRGIKARLPLRAPNTPNQSDQALDILLFAPLPLVLARPPHSYRQQLLPRAGELCGVSHHHHPRRPRCYSSPPAGRWPWRHWLLAWPRRARTQQQQQQQQQQQHHHQQAAAAATARRPSRRRRLTTTTTPPCASTSS